jgi:hypothetical protein
VGNKVASHKNPADTATEATVTIYGVRPTNTSYTFTYSLTVPPHGTINRILIVRDTMTKATICAAAPCAASGPVINVTDTTLYRLMRNVATSVRIYTDSDPAGAAEGVVFPAAP